MNDLGLFYECFGRELLGSPAFKATASGAVTIRFLLVRTVFGAYDRDGGAHVHVVDL